MTQFPRLNSGKVGAVGFEHMNALFDAATQVASLNLGAPGAGPRPPSGLWVELLASSTINGFAGWTWRQVAKQTTAAVGDHADLLTSSKWGDQGGLAVSLDGSAAVAGDKVFIYPLASFDTYAWFGFAKGGGTVQRLIDITGTGSSPPFTYAGTVDGASVAPVNLYEQEPYGYGQSLTFDNGTIEVEPCSGTVLCSLIGGVWYFSEKNPETPNCGTP